MSTYEERLRAVGLRSLLHRRVVADIIFCFKLLRGELKLYASKYWIYRPSGLRSNGFNLHYPMIHKKNHTQLFNFVFYRVARLLRRLPREVLNAQSNRILEERLKQINVLQILRIPESLT